VIRLVFMHEQMLDLP